MAGTPTGLRPHILLLGRRNVGKSSLVNALTGQPLALVSDVPGTTTDPVRKAFELLPFGPVVFVDTGGVDDSGPLGEMRVQRARQELASADVVLLVAAAGEWAEPEMTLLSELNVQGVPHLVVVNKIDQCPDGAQPVSGAHPVSARDGQGVDRLRESLTALLIQRCSRPPIIAGDLFRSGALVVLVTPIDLEAPAGRLILPQVMTIRDILDHDGAALVVKERELHAVLASLGRRPDLVICDSQVVLKVVGDVPPDVPLTTFSILFARLKGDLSILAEGARTIDRLADGDRVLVAEACSHHAQGDDIGKVKIPRWLRQYTGRDLMFEHTQGRDWPADLERFRLVIHCGACMLTPRAMSARLGAAGGRGVPVTNYGLAIAQVHGVLDRVLGPFGREAGGPAIPTAGPGSGA